MPCTEPRNGLRWSDMENWNLINMYGPGKTWKTQSFCDDLQQLLAQFPPGERLVLTQQPTRIYSQVVSENNNIMRNEYLEHESM